MSALLLIGHGAVRFVAEFFREPDVGIFGLSYTVSTGQWLSLPMIAAGVAMLVWSRKAALNQLYGLAIASSIRKTHPGPTESGPQEKSVCAGRRERTSDP